MPYSDEQINEAAKRFERWADSLDPKTTRALDISDLRAVAEAADAVQADEARLREAVEIARAHGRSWNRIAVALGVTKQAARQRFGDKAHA